MGLGFLLMCHVITMGVSLAGIALYLFNLYHNNRMIGNKKNAVVSWNLIFRRYLSTTILVEVC